MSGSDSGDDRGGVRSKPRRRIERAEARPVAPKPETHDEEDRWHRLAAFWPASASWLVSALVHTILILILGMLTLSLVEKPTTMFLTAAVDQQQAAELEDMPLGDQLDQIELEQSQALPVQLEDPGMAALGEPSGIDASEISDVGTITISTSLGEIGTLFGKDGKGYASAGDGTGGATFFGVKAGGRKFVFVVDGSRSMRKNGWEACKRELMTAVRRLRPYQFFYVILFASDSHRMFGQNKPEPRLVRATSENIAKLERWLYAYELELGTKPLESMKYALQLRPDAVYFLTDGKLHDDTEGYLKKKNKRQNAYEETVPGAVVHTIGFYTNDGQAVLQRIAKQSGGGFRFVAPPPSFKPPKAKQNR